MDLLVLDKGSFYPVDMVQSYSSLIWKESYTRYGEFELKTGKLAETLALISEGSLVSIRESWEVMIVEMIKIGRDADGKAELTITGRSFETFLENRCYLYAYSGQKWKMKRKYRPSRAAALLAWNSVVNDTAIDQTKAGVSFFHRPEDRISNVAVSDSSWLNQPTRNFFLEDKNHYELLIDILDRARLGVRTIRPVSNNANIISVGGAGNLLVTKQKRVNDLRIDIYNGVDRTQANQKSSEAVVFHHAQKTILNPEYLISGLPYRSTAVLSTPKETDYNGYLEHQPGLSNPTGLNLKYAKMSIGEIKEDDTNEDVLEEFEQKAQRFLRKAEKITLLTGDVPPTAKYVFGKHYYLGDKVSYVGEWGFNQVMLVSEYVRVSDKEGSRGWPTLEYLRSV